MANEYAVNRDDLAAVAEAIRAKNDTEDALVFPEGFVAAIGEISTGTDDFSVISVTYPSGAVCSAQIGENTLTSPDTSGSWKFVARHEGTWTITATNASTGESSSKDIDIVLDSAVYTVKIVFPLSLIVDGVPQVTFSAAAGGTFDSSMLTGAPSVSSGSGCVILTQQNNRVGNYSTASTVNLDGYSLIRLRAKKTYVSAASNYYNYWSNLNVSRTFSGAWAGSNNVASARVDIPLTTEPTEVLCDISRFTGSYYIAIGIYHTMSIYIYDLSLE